MCSDSVNWSVDRNTHPHTEVVCIQHQIQAGPEWVSWWLSGTDVQAPVLATMSLSLWGLIWSLGKFPVTNWQRKDNGPSLQMAFRICWHSLKVDRWNTIASSCYDPRGQCRREILPVHWALNSAPSSFILEEEMARDVDPRWFMDSGWYISWVVMDLARTLKTEQ